MSPYFYTINYTFLSHIIFKIFFVLIITKERLEICTQIMDMGKKY